MDGWRWRRLAAVAVALLASSVVGVPVVAASASASRGVVSHVEVGTRPVLPAQLRRGASATAHGRSHLKQVLATTRPADDRSTIVAVAVALGSTPQQPRPTGTSTPVRGPPPGTPV